MVAPVVVAAYHERENILKVIVYAIAGIAIIYALYKLFGAFKSIGEKIEKAVEGVKEGISEIKEYGATRPLTPDDTAKIITKRASKEPGKPYLVEKNIYEGLKEQGRTLPRNVKPYSLKESMKKSPVKVERKTSTIGSKLGLWTPKEEKKQSGSIVPRYVSMEEYKDIEAKRWEAMAKYYPKPQPKELPHILPVDPRKRLLVR